MEVTSSRRNAAISIASNVGISLMQATTGVVLARLLGREGRGQFQAIQLWGFFLASFALMGVSDAVVFLVAKERARAGVYLVSAMVLGFCTSLVFMAVGWFIIPVVLANQEPITKDLARLFLLTIPLYVVGLIPINGLRGLSLFGRWNLIRWLGIVVWLGVIAGSYAAGQFNVTFLTIGYVVVLFVVLVVALALAVPTHSRPFHLELKTWTPLLKFGIPGVLSTVPQLLNLRADQLLLVRFVSNDQLGLYVVAVAWAGVTAPVLAGVGAVLFPRLAGEDDVSERQRVFARGVRYSLLLSGVLGSAVLAATPIGISLLFGPQFAEAVPAAAVLVVAGVVLAFGTVVEEGMRGFGHPREVLFAEIGGLVVTGLLLAVLLRPFGIVGAAIASFGGYTATAGVLMARMRHIDAVPRLGLLVPHLADVKEFVEMVLNRTVSG